MPKPFPPLPGRSRPVKVLLDVMDVVLQDLDVAAGARDANPGRRAAAVVGAVVADLQALDAHVTHVVQRHQRAPPRGPPSGGARQAPSRTAVSPGWLRKVMNPFSALPETFTANCWQ